MIRHTVLLRFKTGVESSRIDGYVRDLAQLPAAIPEVLFFSYGLDVGASALEESASNWDFVVTAWFRSIADYRVYAKHPAHLALVEAHVRELVHDRAAIQTNEPDYSRHTTPAL